MLVDLSAAVFVLPKAHLGQGGRGADKASVRRLILLMSMFITADTPYVDWPFWSRATSTGW